MRCAKSAPSSSLSYGRLGAAAESEYLGVVTRSYGLRSSYTYCQRILPPEACLAHVGMCSSRHQGGGRLYYNSNADFELYDTNSVGSSLSRLSIEHKTELTMALCRTSKAQHDLSSQRIHRPSSPPGRANMVGARYHADCPSAESCAPSHSRLLLSSALLCLVYFYERFSFCLVSRYLVTKKHYSSLVNTALVTN
jgi:hypothetical protein